MDFKTSPRLFSPFFFHFPFGRYGRERQRETEREREREREEKL